MKVLALFGELAHQLAQFLVPRGDDDVRAVMALEITLRQLEVFASLCATRSFRRSAESLEERC